MQLDQEAVLELQQILSEEYNKTLSLEETEIVGTRLVNLYQNILTNNQNKKHETKWLSPFASQ